MLLKQIQLTHFRHFKTCNIQLHPRLTVFVGNNGEGKTAILDSIAIGLAPILSHLPKVSAIYFKENDIHINHHAETAAFVRVQLETLDQLVWDVTKKRDQSQKTIQAIPKNQGVKQLTKYLDAFIDALNENQSTTLPVFVYYDINRVVPDTIVLKPPVQKDLSRFKALNNALQPNTQFKDALEWFYAMEFEELKNQQARQDFNYRLPVLETVRQAMTTMIPMISNPHISTNPPHLMVSWQKKNGDIFDLKLEQLSDGYRTLLALVMDLARRLAQANPHLINPLHSEAIVLIDEIDLHLHPELQQTVLLDLQRTFPNTQFIVTTHSPQVLTTVQKENIRLLENETVYEQLTNTYGAESSRLLEEVMSVSSRPEPLPEVQKLNKYLELVNQGDFDTDLARSLRGELEQTFCNGDSALQLADMVIRRHKALGT